MFKIKRYFSIVLSALCMFFISSIIDSYAVNRDISSKSIQTFPFSENGVMSIKQIKDTGDGGLIVVGSSTSPNIGLEIKGSGDAIIIKCNKDYSVEWKNSFGGTKLDTFENVIETQDRGFIAVGYSLSTDAEFENKGGYDAIIVKYDKNGEQQWIKSFGGSAMDWLTGIEAVGESGFFVVGYSVSANAGFQKKGYQDAILIKYDDNGNQEWIKNWGYTETHAEFVDIIKSSRGEYVVIGGFPNVLLDNKNDNKNNRSGILIKFNELGEQISISFLDTTYYSEFNDIIEYSDDGFVCVGEYLSRIEGDTEYKGGTRDAIVVKYDKNNNLEWCKKIGGNSLDQFQKVIELSNGDILALGKTSSTGNGIVMAGGYDTMIARYSKEGEEKWFRTFGGSKSEAIFSVLEIDGNIIMNINSNSPEITGGTTKTLSVHYNYDYEHIFDELESIETDGDINKIKITRENINNIPEGIFKEYFQDRLNNASFDLILERKIATANLDIYIKCENILQMSLDTNSITFEDFSGIEDMEKNNAINITINSSLPYQLNAYLPTEIQNADKTNTMDKSILNIKESSELDYKGFNNINEKVVLKDNCPSGNDLVHGVDIKLNGGIAHEKDVYKTTIKFEAEQK